MGILNKIFGNGRQFLWFCLYADLCLAIFITLTCSIYFGIKAYNPNLITKDNATTMDNAITETEVSVAATISTIFIGLTIVWFSLEIYLFKLLRRGLKEKAYSTCLNWLCFRLVIFCFAVVMRMCTLFYNILNGQPLAFYWDYPVQLFSVFELIAGYRYVKYLRVISIRNAIDEEALMPVSTLYTLPPNGVATKGLKYHGASRVTSTHSKPAPQRSTRDIPS